MMGIYDAFDWYWIVASDAAHVFASGRGEYVAASTDATYEAWLAGGNLPTRIATDGELSDVLTKAGLPAATIAAAGASDWGEVPPDDILNVMLMRGVALTSTATPALDDTYAITPPWQQKIAAVASYIAINGKLPAGLTTLAWPNAANTANRVFPSAASFKAFATAVADYVTECGLAAAGAGSWPASNAITIP